jgi:acetyl esterase/lipase
VIALSVLVLVWFSLLTSWLMAFSFENDFFWPGLLYFVRFVLGILTPPIMRFCWFNGNPFHIAQDGLPVDKGVYIQHNIRYSNAHTREIVDVLMPSSEPELRDMHNPPPPASAWSLGFMMFCARWLIYDIFTFLICYPRYILANGSPSRNSTDPDGDSSLPRCPALLFIHGGGWVAVDSSYQLHQVVPLARAGFKVYSINYPHAPEDPFPAAVLSTLRSLAWIRSTEGYEQCSILGESAGGNIATFVVALLANPGLMSDFANLVQEPVNTWKYPNVPCVLSWYGILDQHSWQGGFGPWSSLVRGMNWCLIKYRGQLCPQTPLTLVDLLRNDDNDGEIKLKQFPPSLLISGTVDPLGLQRSSSVAHKALEKKGFDVTLLEYPSAHAFISFPPFVSEVPLSPS